VLLCAQVLRSMAVRSVDPKTPDDPFDLVRRPVSTRNAEEDKGKGQQGKCNASLGLLVSHAPQNVPPTQSRQCSVDQGPGSCP